MIYFDRLLDLLQLERTYDRESYRLLIENTGINERRLQGVTWYPVAIKDTEPAYGDYINVVLERTSFQDINHSFRSGASVVLFSGHHPEERRIEGIVSFQSGNRIRINLRTDELPEWTREGKLGIDLLFDENSYEEMEKALKRAAKVDLDTDLGRLIRVCTGDQSPRFDPIDLNEVYPDLNESQQQAVRLVTAAKDLAIVHGPPGTGKTTTIVSAIQSLVRKKGNKRILVTAPSNTAVDQLAERLAESGLNVLRVGNPVRVSERLLSLTLDGKIEAHEEMKQIKRLKKQAGQFRDMAHKYKRNFGKAEREQRKALFQEAHQLLAEAERIEQYIVDDIISRTEVVAATLVGAAHYSVRHLQYDAVVVDEAGQALEPAVWICLQKSNKLILAGDHLQLPPTIKSDEASRAGLSETLLEKMVAKHPDAVTMLTEQYRMHEDIMGFSARAFYKNELKAHPSVARHTLYSGAEVLRFIDTAGCGFDEESLGTSVVNPEEAAFLMKHLSAALLSWEGKVEPSVAIIAPYKAQIQQLEEISTQYPEIVRFRHLISINTVDGFQGQERDVVYISLTRSNADGSIGFLSDIRRMNVAMTRARKQLIVIGDSATISREAFYADFIAYTEERNAYVSAWEFMNW